MLTHLAEAFGDFHHTGAFLPSTGHFARNLTEAVRRPGPPRRILEVGPGTGPMTRQIVRHLRPGDSLDVVEISEAFADRIERDYLAPTRRRLRSTAINLIRGPIQDVPLEGGYVLIISSLPLNNFDIRLVRRIMDRFHELLAPDGELHFWEYLGLRRMGMLLGKPESRRRLSAITRFYAEFDRHPGVSKKAVLFNFPPTVHRSKLPTVSSC